MSVKAVGLDIGAEQVKAVALHKRRQQCILSGVGLSAIPPGANDEAVAQAVKAALREAGAGKNAAVCAAVGGPTVVVKGMRLPRTPLPRVLEAVRWSLQEHGLLPVSGAILDAQVLSTATEGQMQLLAVCVPQELMDRRQRILARAGVTPQKMDVEPLALLNGVLAMQEGVMDDTLVLLSLAPKAALVCVYHAAAGAPLIRYLQSPQQSTAAMIAEIRTAVAYFQAELEAESALRLVYCGPQNIFTALKGELQGLLALWNHHEDPTLFDPLARLEGAQRLLLDGQSIEGSQFTQAVGLAMRAL